MRVEIIKERRLQAAGPSGPFVRVFSIGDLVDLPDSYASAFISGGHARIPVAKPAPKPKPVDELVEETVEAPAVPRAKRAKTGK